MFLQCPPTTMFFMKTYQLWGLFYLSSMKVVLCRKYLLHPPFFSWRLRSSFQLKSCILPFTGLTHEQTMAGDWKLRVFSSLRALFIVNSVLQVSFDGIRVPFDSLCDCIGLHSFFFQCINYHPFSFCKKGASNHVKLLLMRVLPLL